MKTVIGSIAALIGLNYFFPNLFSSIMGIGSSISTSNSNLPTSITGPTSSVNLRQALLQKSGLLPSGRLNFDQWNYYFQQVRGVYAQPQGLVSGDLLLTVDEWMQLAQVSEATGLQSGMSGIGMGVPSNIALAVRVIPNSGERITKQRVN